MDSENKVISRIPKLSGRERKVLRHNVDNKLQIDPDDTAAIEVLAALNDFEESIPKPTKKKASSIKWEPQPSPKSCGKIDGKAVAYIFRQESDSNDRNHVFSVSVLGKDIIKRMDSVREAKQVAWDHYLELVGTLGD